MDNQSRTLAQSRDRVLLHATITHAVDLLDRYWARGLDDGCPHCGHAGDWHNEDCIILDAIAITDENRLRSEAKDNG
jgi:hypothetical protein